MTVLITTSKNWKTLTSKPEITVGDAGYGTTIEGAVIAIGSNLVRLRVPTGAHSFSADFTVPANITVYLEPGAILTRAAGDHLTINGPFECGDWQCFDDNSVGHNWVVFGAGAVKEAYPEWWATNTVPGTTDMTAALQAALTACNSATGVGTVRISGRYKTTADLSVGAFTSIIGDNPEKHRIEPAACNGLVFTSPAASTSLGPKIITGFSIIGTGCGAKSGISNDIPAVYPTNKLEGLDISNLRIKNFGWGMKFIGLWNSRIEKNYIYPCDVGIALTGKSISTIIQNNNIEYAAVAGSAGTSTGLVISNGTYGDGTVTYPEATRVVGNQFYGQKIAINHVIGSQITIDGNHLDNFSDYGILSSGYSNSGLRIINNWIYLGDSAGYCIRNAGSPAGGPFRGLNQICNNVFSGYLGRAGQYGVSLEANSHTWNIEGNTFCDLSAYDIQLSSITAFGMINVKNNNLRGPVGMYVYNTAAQSVINIEDNKIAYNLTLHATQAGIINIGRNTGQWSTYIRGYTTILSGQTTATTDFADLYGAPNDFPTPSATYNIYPRLRILSHADDIGHVFGIPSETGVTITCTTAPGADKKVYWEVIAVAADEN